MDKKPKEISFIGLSAAFICTFGYLLLARWISSQSKYEFLYLLPAILSFILFCIAIIRSVHPLEDFWQIKRSHIDHNSKSFVTLSIIFFVIAMNIMIIAFAYVKTKNQSLAVTMSRFHDLANDVYHYIDIAQNGYFSDATDHRLFIVFFPLYPLLVRACYYIVGDYLLSATLVSNIFAILSGIIFHRMALLVTSPKKASLATKFLFIFPAAFFLFIPMTESLYLFLSVSCIYLLLKKRYLLMYICGIFAALTRLQGLLLIVPVFIELLSRTRTDHLNGHFTLKKTVGRFLLLTSFFIGFFIYLIINKIVYGDFFKFLEFQSEHWEQQLNFFWNTAAYLGAYFDSWVLKKEYLTAFVLALANIISLWGSLLLLALGAKKIRISLTMYGLGYFIISFGASWLLSGPRYAVCMFPLAFCLAEVSNSKWKKRILVGLCIILYITYFGFFISRGPIY